MNVGDTIQRVHEHCGTPITYTIVKINRDGRPCLARGDCMTCGCTITQGFGTAEAWRRFVA